VQKNMNEVCPVCLSVPFISMSLFLILVVLGAYYKIISQTLPARQANNTMNQCLQSIESQIMFSSFCHVFRVRKGFTRSYNDKKIPIAFESVCIPGYYIGSKNYKLQLMKEEPTTLFSKIL